MFFSIVDTLLLFYRENGNSRSFVKVGRFFTVEESFIISRIYGVTSDRVTYRPFFGPVFLSDSCPTFVRQILNTREDNVIHSKCEGMGLYGTCVSR